MLRSIFALFCFVVVAVFETACVPSANSNAVSNGRADQGQTGNSTSATGATRISTTGDPNVNLSQEEIDRGRTDDSWKRFVQIEASDETNSKNDEKLAEITPEAVNSGKMHLPLSSGEGPSVLRAQLLLDRSPFSPGILDGLWGKNTEKAVYWLQKREGLKATGTIDQATFKRLFELANNPNKLIVEHKLTEKDVSGPFVDIPEDIYAQAKLDCMCYESLSEKLAEMFHTSPDLLGRLNPGKNLDQVKAGDILMVPNVTDTGSEQKKATDSGSTVAKLVISDGGHYIHAVDSQDRILYHFPSTLGSTYAPSPTGEWKINVVAHDPAWHYQPDLLTGVPDDKRDAMIPAGPNNPVGKVWMDLSKEHYGIHGTKAPETIGYATSHGCVRLTNWDAVFLADRVKEGTAVTFTDAARGGNSGANTSG
jgi:lipoprotein-anchoring transpeptidase ErfK/SrfK